MSTTISTSSTNYTNLYDSIDIGRIEQEYTMLYPPLRNDGREGSIALIMLREIDGEGDISSEKHIGVCSSINGVGVFMDKLKRLQPFSKYSCDYVPDGIKFYITDSSRTLYVYSNWVKFGELLL